MIRKSTIEKLKNPDNKELLSIIKGFEALEYPIYREEESYYDGQNSHILNRKISDDKNVPDNKIPVSYGKKIVKTVAGYLFKPGSVLTRMKNEEQQKKIDDIYKANHEDTKTSIEGSFIGVNGLCFELHYYEYDNATNSLYPRFTFLKASEGIPVYDYSIDPELICFIRPYKRDDTCYYEVYYNDVTQFFIMNMSTGEMTNFQKDKKNEYGSVPVVVHRNNEFYTSDISLVKPLIDAYDVLMSDSMNEFDRFSFAYLLLVGLDVETEDAAEIKAKRMFTNLPSADAVSFLTKEIPTTFISYMSDLIRKEIHKQSFIPDVDEITFSGGTSGVTIDKWIYMMEYTAADKEAYMRQALDNRLKLLESLGEIDLTDGYEFIFKRNLPSSEKNNADIYNLYYGKGISTETLISTFATFVRDVQAELAKAEEEKSQSVDVDLMSSVVNAIGQKNQPAIQDDSAPDKKEMTNGNLPTESKLNK